MYTSDVYFSYTVIKYMLTGPAYDIGPLFWLTLGALRPMDTFSTCTSSFPGADAEHLNKSVIAVLITV